VRKLLAALLLIPALACAGPNDIVATQRNATDSGLAPARLVTAPTGGASAVMGYNGATNLPVHWLIGSGLGVASGALVSLPQDWATITGKPALSTVATTGAYADLSGRPTLFSGAYSALTGVPSTFTPAAHTQAWSTITSTPTTLSGYGITDAATGSALAGKFNTPTGTTSQYVRGDGSLATLPTASVPTQSSATRSLNTIYQVSGTRPAWVTYSVQLTVTATIAGGQNGDVVLEIASDAGFTASVQTLSISGLGQVYSLAVAIQGVQPQTGVVSGFVPAGYYVRLRTVNNTGTPAYLFRAGQETLL